MTQSMQLKGAGDNGPMLHLDDETGHLISMATVHHEIHQGNVFSACQADAILADNGTLVFTILHATIDLHFRIKASCGGNFDMALFEAPTVNVAGAVAAKLNHNRALAATKVSTSAVLEGSTFTVEGTELCHQIVPGGAGPHASGASSADFEGWILKANTLYMVRITNVSGGVQPTSLAIDWIEKQNV